MQFETITRVISAGAIALAATILGLCAVVDSRIPTAPVGAPAPVVLQEDDPGWDCRTMGNRDCERRHHVPAQWRAV